MHKIPVIINNRAENRQFIFIKRFLETFLLKMEGLLDGLTEDVK